LVTNVAVAQNTDVIRGQVTGPDNKAIPGVNVRATSYNGGVTRSTRTDAGGRYTVVFQNGEGDYWLEFRAIGYFAKRFEIKRVADEQVLFGDAKLASSIATLDAVNVTTNAPRALPSRTDINADISGTDRVLSTTDLPADAAGNLAAAAALQPGMQLIPGFDGAPDAFSALGLAPEQNATTVNGLASGLTTLPRDAQTTAAVRTFNYDPAIGGFSGAQVSVTTRSGTNFSNRLLSGVSRTPATEVSTDLAEAEGMKNSVLSFGGNAAGPIQLDKAFYNFSYQLDRDVRPFRTLATTSAAAFSASGVAADTVARLLGILGRLGIPTTSSGASSSQTNDRVSLQGNLDFAPGTSGAGHAFNLSATTNLSNTANIGFPPNSLLSTQSHSGESRFWSSSAALRHSNYFWFGILGTTTLGVSAWSNATEPYTRMPQGMVRVQSSLPDGSSAIRTLMFGGSPTKTDRHGTTVELMNQSVWYEGSNRHALKLTSDLRLETFASQVSSEESGTFSFAALADLENGRPESFERMLAPRTNVGRQATFAGSLGDSWRPTTGLQIQYGVRVDGNRLLTNLPFNSGIADRFGARNDYVPNALYASPRLGFQWIYGKAPVVQTALLTARPPRALIQGGVGVFQNIAPAQNLLDPVLNNTGLHDAARIVQCIGAAVPVPVWSAYGDPARVPTTCPDGGTSVFGASAPTVMLYDPQYRQSRSLRANLGSSGPVWSNRVFLSASVQYQWGFAQPGTVDINLDTVPKFSLPAEDGRPVFVSPSFILPTTGVAPLRASRIDDAFGRVSSIRSSLGQETRLATLAIRPVFVSSTANWSLAYTWQDAKEQFFGFSSAAGNPFARAWSGALFPRRHSVLATFFYNAFDLVRWSGFAGVASGALFTPVVLGDVNGDGNSLNDRAFIFDPARTEDSALTAALQRVIAGATPRVRDCLVRQINVIAARGSCTGPWQFAANLNAALNSQKLHLPPRAHITINLNNPLVLADMIVHGEGRIRGWGQQLTPDPVLYAVKGFDPTTQRFQYAVNGRFGSTRPDQGIQRGQTYFALSVSFDIGASRERQLLLQRLDAGRNESGEKPTAPALKAFAASTIPNPIALILQQPDSLGLNRRQADSLAAMNRSFTQLADSVWSAAAVSLAALPERYDRAAANKIYVRARERAIDRLILLAPRVWSILRPEQQRMLPQTIRDWLDIRVLRAVRSSTAG
jgi:hypothetical protein